MRNLTALVIAGVMAIPVAGRVADAKTDATTPPSGNADRGKVLYQACTACHSVDDNDIGPKHRGVFGRHAAGVGDYAYSGALKQSGLVWDRNTLDRWLTNPSALVPGTKMFFKVDDPQSRADIIAYLQELR